jgi:hypothetical protein
MNGPQPARYAEDRCALRGPLWATGLAVPSCLVAAFVGLGIAVAPEWFIAAVLVPLFAPFLIATGLLYRNWPTGIRIDEREVRIGAVRSHRAQGRTPTVTHQNWGVFVCPWAAVRTLDVVTDPRRLRELRTSPRFYTLSNRWGKPRAMTACMLGVLTAPFMKAALVIELDADAASAPAVRSALFFPNKPGRPLYTTLRAEVSPVWVAPTRRAEALRAFVASVSSGNTEGDDVARRE